MHHYRQLICLLAICFTVCCANAADPVTAPALHWHDAATMAVEGQGWTDTAGRYDRLPARAEALVRKPVWSLSRNSTGLCVDFSTDATTISARWTVHSDRLAMNHMAATGVSGLDLYVRDGKQWQFLAVGRPTDFPTNEVTLVRGLAPGSKDFRIYLPLYNGVGKLEIGVPETAAFKAAESRAGKLKAVVVYGTSITQGGCASRPGMAYPSILGRRLDVPVINLGFSGNGKAEPEMAALLSELDASVFVIDCLPNLETADAIQRVPALLDTIRKSHPRTPLLLVENVAYTDAAWVATRDTKSRACNEFLRKHYQQRVDAGDKKLFYAAADDLLGRDGEGTVDGTHPTDLGFQRMADALEPVLKQALAASTEPAAASEEGFVSLFDGKTLAGWKPHLGVPREHIGGKWFVKNGILFGQQDEREGGGFLVTDGQYDNFVLRFDLAQDYPSDTGVFVRMGADGKSHQLTLDNRPEGEIGSIYLPWTQKRVLHNPEGDKSFRQDAWNQVEVRVEGEPSRLQMWMNGTLITDFQHTADTTKNVPAKGYLGLQVHPKVPSLTHFKPGTRFATGTSASRLSDFYMRLTALQERFL